MDFGIVYFSFRGSGWSGKWDFSRKFVEWENGWDLTEAMLVMLFEII